MPDVKDDSKVEEVQVPVEEAPEATAELPVEDQSEEAPAEEAKEEPAAPSDVPEADREWHEKTYKQV